MTDLTAINEARDYFAQSQACRTNGDLEEALRLCDMAIQCAPEWSEAYNLRGAILEGLRRSDEAAFSFNEAIRLYPESRATQENLAEVEKYALSREALAHVLADVKPARPSGKFSLRGMLLTFLGGVGVGVVAALLFYGLDSFLSFGIPLLYPALTGAVVGLVTIRLGSTIGQCRNLALAVIAAALAAAIGWSSGHFIDYLRYRAEFYSYIVREYPQAQPAQINRAIDAWFIEQTGQSGFVGFILEKAATSNMEIQTMVEGVPHPPASFSGSGLIAYWLVELLVAAGIAGYLNRNYSKTPYCDQCHAWRNYKTPVIGTSTHLGETVDHLQQRNISAALASLRQHPEGSITRLEVEFCPKCFNSRLARLVVVQDTGPLTWVERTVWADRLEPLHIRQIIESADYH